MAIVARYRSQILCFLQRFMTLFPAFLASIVRGLPVAWREVVKKRQFQGDFA